jgi:L-amino acid N-acyltransferase
MHNLNLRKATEEDLPIILEIYNEALLTTNAHYFSEPVSLEERKKWFHAHGEKHPVFVAEINDQIIGWASLTRWSPYHAFEDSVESSVYIHKDHRGKGMGKILLNKVIEVGSNTGIHTIVARILEGNPGSIKIHEELGFEHIGIMKDIGKKNGKYLDLFMMQKMIK